MGQVRHGSATTTHAVRAAIHRSGAALAALSRELGINPKTVPTWRKRATVEDLKTGPKEPRSTVLTEAEEAAVVAFRRHTLLPARPRQVVHRSVSLRSLVRGVMDKAASQHLGIGGKAALADGSQPAEPGAGPRARQRHGACGAQAGRMIFPAKLSRFLIARGCACQRTRGFCFRRILKVGQRGNILNDLNAPFRAGWTGQRH